MKTMSKPVYCRAQEENSCLLHFPHRCVYCLLKRGGTDIDIREHGSHRMLGCELPCSCSGKKTWASRAVRDAPFLLCETHASSCSFTKAVTCVFNVQRVCAVLQSGSLIHPLSLLSMECSVFSVNHCLSWNLLCRPDWRGLCLPPKSWD